MKPQARNIVQSEGGAFEKWLGRIRSWGKKPCDGTLVMALRREMAQLRAHSVVRSMVSPQDAASKNTIPEAETHGACSIVHRAPLKLWACIKPLSLCIKLACLRCLSLLWPNSRWRHRNWATRGGWGGRVCRGRQEKAGKVLSAGSDEGQTQLRLLRDWIHWSGPKCWCWCNTIFNK